MLCGVYNVHKKCIGLESGFFLIFDVHALCQFVNDHPFRSTWKGNGQIMIVCC